MLRIAIPNKGSLSDGAVALLKGAGYKCKRSGRELMVCDVENDIEFVYLRPRDIAVYVGNGVLDLGISGRDLVCDSQIDVPELLSLDFGGSSFYYAIPKELDLTPEDFGGMKIATSYPNIVKADLEKRGVEAEVVCLDGAVEISIKLGVADVIADVVESGRTLIEAGLKTIGTPVMKSEAVLIAQNEKIIENKNVKVLIDRIKGILVAQSYAMIEYDIPKVSLDDACKVTPGIESPTIAPLNNSDWVAVKSMVTRGTSNKIMDELKELGAKGIIVTDIRSCRL
jgi:ATP phosphoribosyltransferase